MERFSVLDIQNNYSKILNQATVEPALLTGESQKNYVIMSLCQ